MARLKLVLFFLLFTVASKAQVYINEFMASNIGIITDPDYGQSSDWIELYNDGPSAVNLSGYFLTDNINKPDKWEISNISIPSKGFAVFWADSKDSANHTNFNLNAGLEQIGFYKPDLTVVDTLSYGQQDPNISTGRKTEGSNEWRLFTLPTPRAANSSLSYYGIIRSDPGFSLPGGVYHNPVSIEIRSIFGGDVLYTLDGTEPNEQSALASGPILISSNTPVRARIYKAGMILGPVNTNTYIIDTVNKIKELPIVCISSDPYNLWDPVKGIYVVHSTKPNWEIPVNIELFENDGRIGPAFNLRAGIKSTGLYSWQLPEKMLGVSFRKEYGANKLEYPLIFDKNRKVYSTFSLRASGSDWGNTMFRDGMIQTAAVENTTLDNSGFRACVVYINGEYMGIHNIREKIDEDYITGNYGLTEGSFDMIEETDQGHYAETGDFKANNQFLALIAKDLTIQSNYDSVNSVMDINEFTELVCTEVYTGNSSIGHNLMKWKPKDSGKWKWILMDFDRGFSGINNEMISFYINEDGWPLRELIRNESFKKQFGRKLSDLLFTTFNPERMISEIDDHKKIIETEMPEHVNRWAGTYGTGNYSYITGIPSVEFWLSEVEKLKTFAKARPGIILNDLTKYGFQSPVPIMISTVPENSGNLTFNGLKIPLDKCQGGYPNSEEIKLTAEAKAGYRFLGWRTDTDSILIPKEQIWKYSDIGTIPDILWTNSDFDDSAWKSGQAELGYGDDDEKTVIDFGGDLSNTFTTSYFRKNFSLNNKQNVTSLTISLKCDDGAVIYLNGNEIQRYNMPTGSTGYGTRASLAITGTNESDFHTFSVDPEFLVNGNNTIAVEVHQVAANSSDASFDLELSETLIGNGGYLSTGKELAVVLQSALNISAIFENDGSCTLPSEISTVLTLSKSCSPYLVPENVNIASSGKLIIEPGVEIWMSDGVSIFSSGPILAKGTKLEPIIFRSNPLSTKMKWGNIRIKSAGDTVWFRNVIIENASEGPNPVLDNAALAIENSTVILDSMVIENVYKNPVNLYNCQTIFTNNTVHSDFSGVDLINIKRGTILISHCDFIGNKGLDSDAIDLGDMTENSTRIKTSYFHDMDGFNSDAVDLGDQSRSVIIDSILVYNIQDKGVSIGQQSSAKITNSVFLNCGMGAGMKDSSTVFIDHCIYYGNFYAIANYQKHPGDAGANALVTNSVLSNSYEAGYLSDAYSAISISNSSDDTEPLPEGHNNLNGNPLFTNPVKHDFSLLPGSPLIGGGTDGNIGVNLNLPPIPVSVMISDLVYMTISGSDDLEFIGLYNPGSSAIELDSFKFSEGISFTFPVGVSIGSKEKLFIASNAASQFWNGKRESVYQWESGRLADEGEKIQLVNRFGNVLDQVIYLNKTPWPVPQNPLQGITLSRFDVDNHFGENWKLFSLSEMETDTTNPKLISITVYPNPANDKLNISVHGESILTGEIYSSIGTMTKQIKLNNYGEAVIDVQDLKDGIYLVKIGSLSTKVLIAR